MFYYMVVITLRCIAQPDIVENMKTPTMGDNGGHLIGKRYLYYKYIVNDSNSQYIPVRFVRMHQLRCDDSFFLQEILSIDRKNAQIQQAQFM